MRGQTLSPSQWLDIDLLDIEHCCVQLDRTQIHIVTEINVNLFTYNLSIF